MTEKPVETSFKEAKFHIGKSSKYFRAANAARNLLPSHGLLSAVTGAQSSDDRNIWYVRTHKLTA